MALIRAFRIEYKGFSVAQAPNNHVWVTKDGKTVLHSQCDRPKDEEELKQIVDAYLELTEIKSEVKICRQCNKEIPGYFETDICLACSTDNIKNIFKEYPDIKDCFFKTITNLKEELGDDKT